MNGPGKNMKKYCECRSTAWRERINNGTICQVSSRSKPQREGSPRRSDHQLRITHLLDRSNNTPAVTKPPRVSKGTATDSQESSGASSSTTECISAGRLS